MQTVQTLTGIPIQFSAKITWGGVIEITNAIGGVEVCLANGIKDRDTGINWPAGNRTIQGIDALQFLRTRHGVGNGGDLGRISNQQQYMSRLANKLVSEEVLSNPATLYKLATTAVDNITPSQSLTNPLTLVQIALAVKNVPFSEIVFIQYPVNEDPADPNRLVPNRSAADALWAALATNQPLQLTGEISQGDGVVVVEPDDSRRRLTRAATRGRDAGADRDGGRTALVDRGADRGAADLLERQRQGLIGSFAQASTGYDCWAHSSAFSGRMPGDVA